MLVSIPDYTQTLLSFKVTNVDTLMVVNFRRRNSASGTSGFLRRAMSGRPNTFARRRLTLTRQRGPGQTYPENIRFEHAGIVFVGINMPGSNNNLVLDGNDCVRGSVRTAADCEAANAEYGARDAANAAWLRAGFARARTVKARGLVIAFQADPGFEVPLKDARRRRNKRINGFDGTLFQILAEAADYAGQILLVHGDSHRFRHDHPFGGQPGAPANISRLETFGSPDADWVRVDVDPASPAVFDVRPMPVRRADTGR